tara:strand:- start:6638 stop:7420 length:783 start_codon:yes stop_codon:yes gene_type:complete
MPDDIRSFFGGAPKKPAEVKPDPPAPDAMAIDLTDDKPPSSGEKRKAPEEAVDLTEETPAAKKPKVPETKKTPTKKTPTPKKTPTKKTPTKKTPTRKEEKKELPKPAGYPKPDSELKFSVLESNGAWAGDGTRADPPNKGKEKPRGPSNCLEGTFFSFSRKVLLALYCVRRVPRCWFFTTSCEIFLTIPMRRTHPIRPLTVCPYKILTSFRRRYFRDHRDFGFPGARRGGGFREAARGEGHVGGFRPDNLRPSGHGLRPV